MVCEDESLVVAAFFLGTIGDLLLAGANPLMIIKSVLLGRAMPFAFLHRCVSHFILQTLSTQP